MNVFDIIGPIIIGPSNSHAAGAIRLGYVAGKILGEPPVRAVIRLSGSFAQTCRGHGTDKALPGASLRPGDRSGGGALYQAERGRHHDRFLCCGDGVGRESRNPAAHPDLTQN